FDEIIFEVVRLVVLASAPLDDGMVVTDAHDRRPVTLAPVIFHSGRLPVMTQPQRVSGFMTASLGDVLFAVTQAFWKNPARYVFRVIEGIQIRYTSSTRTIPIRGVTANH